MSIIFTHFFNIFFARGIIGQKRAYIFVVTIFDERRQRLLKIPVFLDL